MILRVPQTPRGQGSAGDGRGRGRGVWSYSYRDGGRPRQSAEMPSWRAILTMPSYGERAGGRARRKTVLALPRTRMGSLKRTSVPVMRVAWVAGGHGCAAL